MTATTRDGSEHLLEPKREMRSHRRQQQSNADLEPCPCCQVSEAEQHELTHQPFTELVLSLRMCQGKKRPTPMSQVLATSKKATNCTFMGENGLSITILAGYDGMTEAFFANMLPCKGSSHRYAETVLQRVVH